MDASQMTKAIGMSPDKVRVRGSNRGDPPVPVCNSWELHSSKLGLHVDEHIAELRRRCEPFTAEMAALAASPDVSVVLEVVRYFNDEQGEPDNGEGNSHQLLGWVLQPADIQFLTALGAAIDVDEHS